MLLWKKNASLSIFFKNLTFKIPNCGRLRFLSRTTSFKLISISAISWNNLHTFVVMEMLFFVCIWRRSSFTIKKNILFLYYHVTTIDQSIDWGKYNIVINIYMPGLMPKVSHRHKYFLSQKFHYHLFAKNRNKKQESQVVFLTVIQLIQLLR